MSKNEKNKNVDSLYLINLKNMYSLSEEWIEEVVFYEEELNFLNALILDKINSATRESIEHKEVYQNIKIMLFKMSKELLVHLKNHKDKLSKLIETKDFSKENECSPNHLKTLEKMGTVKRGIKQLKKALFGYLKNDFLIFSLIIF